MKSFLIIWFCLLSLVQSFSQSPIKLKADRIKSDFLSYKDCWLSGRDTGTVLKENIISFLNGKYLIAHIYVSESLSGCSMITSPTLIYQLENRSWNLKEIIPTGYNFEKISDEFYYSENECTVSNGEVRHSMTLYRFSKGELVTMYEDSGLDQENYFRSNYTYGALYKNKSPGFEEYRDYWNQYIDAINDTIANFSLHSNFNINDKSISFKKKTIKKILIKGVGKDSILTHDIINNSDVYLNIQNLPSKH